MVSFCYDVHMPTEIDWSEYLLKKYKFWEIYLHDDQTYLGRCVIALNRDGNLDPFAETTVDERQEFEVIMADLQKVLKTLYQPDMFNYANLRNVWHHCHWHVIPRYKTTREVLNQEFIDTNWGKNYTPRESLAIDQKVVMKIRDDLRLQLGY